MLGFLSVSARDLTPTSTLCIKCFEVMTSQPAHPLHFFYKPMPFSAVSCRPLQPAEGQGLSHFPYRSVLLGGNSKS